MRQTKHLAHGRTCLGFDIGESEIRLTRTIVLLICLLTGSAIVGAQSDQSNVRFTQGQVNESATVSLGVPLGNYPGRGINLPIGLIYSSTVWRIDHLRSVRNYNVAPPYYVSQSVTQALYAEYSKAGWKSSLDLPQIEWPKTDEIYDYKGRPAVTGFNYRTARVTIHMPDGSTHELRKSDTFYISGSVDKSGTFYSVDGSRMRYDSSGVDTGTLYMPDGTRYVLGHPASQIIDRNGNTLNYNETTRQWTDTLGRVITNPLPATPAVGDFTYSLPGLSGVNGGLQTYTFKWRNLANALTPDAYNNVPALRYMASHYLPTPSSLPTDSNQANYPQTQSTSYQSLFQSAYIPDEDPGVPTPNPVPTLVVGNGQTGGQLFNPIVLTEVILPDGTSYKFSYTVYGEVDKVIYPTRAYENYAYDVTISSQDQFKQPYVQTNRKINSRKMSIDGLGDDIQEWQYLDTGTTGGGYRMTSVIAPDKTRTEIYKNDFPEPGDTTGKKYWPFGLSDATNGTVFEKRVYSTSTNGLGGSLLRRELTQYEESTYTYTYTAAGITPTFTKTVSAYRNPRPNKTVSLIFEGTGPSLAQTTTFAYDLTNEFTTGIDQTQAATYNYAVVSNSSATDIAQAGTIAQIPPGTLARYSETTFSNDSTYRNANILGLATVAKVKDSAGAIVSQSEMVYDEAVYSPAVGRALPTSMKTWDSTKGLVSNSSSFLVTRAKFDNYGNRTIATDAKGYTTTTAYDSTYQAYPVSVTSPVPDSSGTYGSNTAFTSTTNFDTVTGLVLSATDANGQTTTISYVDPATGVGDPLLRPRKVTAPNGHQTITEYGLGTSDTTRYVKVRSQIDGSFWSEAISKYDGIGRTYLTQKIDSHGDVFTKTEYDTMGRPKKATNPYRANETIYWTESFYDDLGRVTKVKTPDNAEMNTAYSLATSGNQIGTAVTVTDQAGKLRRPITNALGQLKRVDEPTDATGLGSIDNPNQYTSYVYDTLNNLTTVNQGAQTRTFAYDSLSRLKQAINPESGTINYAYDNNNNLTTKTDARGVVTTYAYDALNRIKTRVYSNEPSGQTATPNVTYYYDNVTNAKGKLVKVYSSASTTEYVSFDILGRVTRSKQTTDGVVYGTDAAPMTYAYNLSGALIEQKYPSGRVVKNVLDADGDLSIVQSKKNVNSGFFNYAKNFTYTSAGAVSSMQLGNNRWESTQFNSRLQPTQIALGTTQGTTDKLKLDYSYGTTANNGNVQSQTITVPTVGSNAGFTAVQTYTYDSLNRIKDAKEMIGSTQTWMQTFLYDRYGNRNFDTTANRTTTIPSGCPIAVCNPAVDTANNRLVGYQFDNSGNTKIDAENRTFVYDGENKQVEVKNSSNLTVGQYFYDGDGKRVKKYVPATGETTIFVYDSSGRSIAEYSTVVEPAATAKVAYLTNDHLGSPRINTDANGAVISRHDYHPFGEEVFTTQRTTALSYTADTVRKKFTGYERDGETELDFAQARYYAKNFGRFNSVDPIMMEKKRLSDPQAINLYIYTRNNPLKYVDPDGEDYEGIDGKKVIIKREKVDGKKIWVVKSDNASKDLQKLVGLVNASGSKTASSQFGKLNDHATMINIVIDTKTVGGCCLGLHEPSGTRPDGSKGTLKFGDDDKFEGKADTIKDSKGNEVYAKATITLYEGEYRAAEGSTDQSVADGLVSTFGHESRHDLDPRQIQAGKNGEGSNNIWHPEKNGKSAKRSPDWYGDKISREIEKFKRKNP
jgi:RHS repeat-associated protein